MKLQIMVSRICTAVRLISEKLFWSSFAPSQQDQHAYQYSQLNMQISFLYRDFTNRLKLTS